MKIFAAILIVTLVTFTSAKSVPESDEKRFFDIKVILDLAVGACNSGIADNLQGLGNLPTQLCGCINAAGTALGDEPKPIEEKRFFLVKPDQIIKMALDVVRDQCNKPQSNDFVMHTCTCLLGQ